MIEYITEIISVNDSFDVQQNGININLSDEFDNESYQNEDNLLFKSKSANILNKDEDENSYKKSIFKSSSMELSVSSNKNTEFNNTSEKINSKEAEEKKSFLNLKNIDIFDTSKKDFQFYFIEELTSGVLKVPDSFYNESLIDSISTPFFYDEIRDSNLFQKNKNSSIITKTKKNEQRKDIFRVVYRTNFYIFSPGEFENCIRNLIKLISENKIDINLSKKGDTRKRRKYDLDDIRKKIKNRFLTNLKNALNEKLKHAGSEYLFDFLPPSFVSNVSKEENRVILNKTFKELFCMDFIKGKSKTNQINSQRCKANKKVIDYLEKNEAVSEKIGYQFYRNMKYYEIYNEYLNSKEFEEDIIKLKNTESKKAQSDNEEYIKQYINLALNLNDFFSS
jgi:hypothetical protein